MMEGYKSIFSSKTFWGAALAVISSILGLLGYNFGAEEQKALIEIASVIGTNIGALFAMYGRVVATKAIK